MKILVLVLVLLFWSGIVGLKLKNKVKGGDPIPMGPDLNIYLDQVADDQNYMQLGEQVAADKNYINQLIQQEQQMTKSMNYIQSVQNSQISSLNNLAQQTASEVMQTITIKQLQKQKQNQQSFKEEDELVPNSNPFI